MALAAPALHPGNLAVHCVDLDREDIALLARSGAAVALCPRSNEYIGGRIPNLPSLLAAGVPLAIGTDSLASSPSLSPLAEVARLRRAFPEVPAERLVALLWNGAAVGAPWVGRLSPGFAPGVVAAPLDGAARRRHRRRSVRLPRGGVRAGGAGAGLDRPLPGDLA